MRSIEENSLMMKHLVRMFLVLAGICLAGVLHAQDTPVSGIIRDRNSFRPIPDVHIRIAGSSVLTVSDSHGAYRFSPTGIHDGDSIQFEHVSYETFALAFETLRAAPDQFLQPRVIPMKDVVILGEAGTRSTRHLDLPHMAVELQGRSFETQGFTDAGDLLRTNASIQIDESFSGKKSLSIRGGNADDVVIIYDGVRLNSVFDNTYNVSNIDLGDIDRIEIIKGGATALYGPDASSGVVNIIPKTERDYLLRFQQQIGTYDAGLWGLQAFNSFGPFSASYSARSGGQHRSFSDAPGQIITNRTLQHSASAACQIGSAVNSAGANMLTAHWTYGTENYENLRDVEDQQDKTYTLTAGYRGAVGSLEGLQLNGSASAMDRSLHYQTGNELRTRQFNERSFRFDLNKTARIGIVDVLASYQYGHSSLATQGYYTSILDYFFDLDSYEFTRNTHGFVGIGKLHSATDEDFFKNFDVDVSVRHDIVRDENISNWNRRDTRPEIPMQSHNKTLVKFATVLTGMQSDMVFRFFLSYGNTMKFPSLQQEVSTPLTAGATSAQPPLAPETGSNTEMAMTVTRENLADPVFNGWLISADYFQSSYENKFRTISLPGTPILFYDNVPTAEIRGLEGQLSLFLFKKKLSIDLGASKYFISSAAAFPFKSDLKATIEARIEHFGFTLQALWFSESEQTGILRQLDGSSAEVAIPAFSSIDVHLGNSVPIGPVRLFANISGRNLLQSGSFELRGLALRDRRYYVTVGVQL